MLSPLEMIMKLPGLGGLTEKAPQALAGFLDKLLEENKPLLLPNQGEAQIFYILFPNSKGEYVISIVAADKDDKILRSLKSILLKEALHIIFTTEQ